MGAEDAPVQLQLFGADLTLADQTAWALAREWFSDAPPKLTAPETAPPDKDAERLVRERRRELLRNPPTDVLPCPRCKASALVFCLLDGVGACLLCARRVEWDCAVNAAAANEGGLL